MSNALGLKRRKRADGTIVYYWVATAVSARGRDYIVKTVRLAATEEAAIAECHVLTAELLAWLRVQRPALEFKGTVASLIDCYQGDEDSPYQSVRENTRRAYDGDLRALRSTVGARRIDRLTAKDFASWHRMFAAPVKENGPRRVRLAHGVMTRLRGLLSFGVSMRYPGCADTKAVLDVMEFETPERRGAALTVGQAEKIIAEAIKAGARSIALGQALQFELGLRQIDVIGHWIKSEDTSGIASHGRRWTGGLTWADITAERLAKRTSKTGQEGQWHPAEYPLLVRAIAAFAEAERVGPAIIHEWTGQPYKHSEYAKRWREIADIAKIPRTIWNMDSRAGAITEADEAGAAPDEIRNFATHAAFATTTRYIRRSGEAISRVAKLRVDHRKNEK